MECKHFSHPHYLTFQQLQPGPEINCSGCKLPATGPIYICWQCSFFLHEQCFQATRALNHNSHPSHPLTLIPSPTYPSGSFICNSCNQTGTGFSFSCSNCDFDLHLHCAYNPQTNPHESSSYPFGPTQNFYLPNENQNFHSQFPFPPPISTHESYPNAPNFNVIPSIPTHHESYPNFPTPNFNAQYNYIPQSANHEPIFNNHPPRVHVHVQHPNKTVHSFNNVQMGPENGIHGPNFQHPLPNQTPPSFNSPVSPQAVVHQSFQIMSNPQNPPPYELVPQCFNTHTGPETGTHGPNLQHPLPNQMPPSFNSPMGPQPVVHQSFQSISNPQNPPPYEAVLSFNAHTSPETGTHGHGHNLQHPLPNQTPPTSNPSPYEAVPSSNAQARPEATETPSNANKPINVSASSENQQKLKRVKHFSHDHPLFFSEIKEEDGIICYGCEQKVSGSAYTCIISNCDFNLHNSCFRLPRKLKHKSHPEHSLSLLSTPPYEEDHEFTCNACLEYGGAFVYHCSTCKFDLHVDCAFLPETVDREDHEHSLALLYSFPFKKAKEDDPALIVTCDVCQATVDQRHWFYYCQDCDFGTHLGCIAAEQCQEEEPSEAVSEQCPKEEPSKAVSEQCPEEEPSEAVSERCPEEEEPSEAVSERCPEEEPSEAVSEQFPEEEPSKAVSEQCPEEEEPSEAISEQCPEEEEPSEAVSERCLEEELSEAISEQFPEEEPSESVSEQCPEEEPSEAVSEQFPEEEPTEAVSEQFPEEELSEAVSELAMNPMMLETQAQLQVRMSQQTAQMIANHEPLFNNHPHVHVHVQPPNETMQSFNAPMGPENSIHGPNFQHPIPNQQPPSFNSPMGPPPVVHQSFQSFQNMSNPQNPPLNEAVPSFTTHTGPEAGTHGPNQQHPLPNRTPPPSFNPPKAPALNQPSIDQPSQNIPNLPQPPPYEAMPNFNAQMRPETTAMPSNANPQNPSLNEAVPSFTTHTGPETGTHGPNLQHPLPNQTPPPSFNPPPAQPSMHQPSQDIPNLPQPPPYEAVPNFNAQTRPETTAMPSNANKPINVSASGENQQKLKGVKHFSHHHPLLLSEIKEEDGIICSGCEQKVSGSAYTCTDSNCNFHLHNSCFGLPREIKKHKSHPEHTLSLLSIPPYEEDQEFTCNACLEYGGAFVYHCLTCKFDLHVDCAFLPETVVREDHEHSLALLYLLPLSVKKAIEDDPGMFLACDVCQGTVDHRCWFYSCKDCNFGSHLGCVAAEQCPEEEPSQAALELTMLDTEAHLQSLHEMEMQMSQLTHLTL